MKSKTHSGLVFTVTLLMLSTICLQSFAAELITLTPNRTHRIEVGGRVRKIYVSNEHVADADPSEDGKSVVIRALSTGNSEIRIERSGGKDVICNLTVEADLSNLARDVETLLADVEGLTVTVVGDKIVLDGKIIVKSHYDRVQQIAQAYSASILNLAKLDRTELNKFVAQAIEADIGLPTITVSVLGDTATLEGAVFDPKDAAVALEKAKQKCSKVVNLLSLEEVMIETDVYFIMIDADEEDESGYNLLKTLSLATSGQNTKSSGAKWTVGGGFEAKLNALAGDGKATFLAKPHLSTKSGAEARFHSGGEVYFEISGTSGGSLEKVEHGVILKVKPVLKGQDRIMCDVTIQVSVPSAKKKGTFSIDKYETKSTTMCNIGESILISGLSQSLETQFREKTPLLGDIPVLSLFFSEKSKKKTNRDLVVVLTPRPVFPTRMGGDAYSKDSKSLITE